METLVLLLLAYGACGSENKWNLAGLGQAIKKTGGKWLDAVNEAAKEIKEIEWKKDVSEIARDAGKELKEVGKGITTGYMEQKDFDQLTSKIIEKEFSLYRYADRWNNPMSDDTSTLAEAATRAKQLLNFHACLDDESFWQDVENLSKGKHDCLYEVNESAKGFWEWFSIARRTKRIKEDKGKSNICLQTKAMLQQELKDRANAQLEVRRRIKILRSVAAYTYLKAFYIFGNNEDNFISEQKQYLTTIFNVIHQCSGGPFGFDERAGEFFYKDMFMKVQKQLREDYDRFFDIESYTSEPIVNLKLNLEEASNFTWLAKSEDIKGKIQNIIQKHDQEHSAYNMKKENNKCCSRCNKQRNEIVEKNMKPEKQNILAYDQNDLAINKI